MPSWPKSTFLVQHSLFFIPCSSFLVHYSLFTIPCSLFPVHYSLFIIPCSLFLVQYSLFIIPCSLFLVHYSLSILNCYFSSSITSFFCFNVFLIAFPLTAGSSLCIKSKYSTGTTCHDNPYLSLHQPQEPSSPPSLVSASQ